MAHKVRGVLAFGGRGVHGGRICQPMFCSSLHVSHSYQFIESNFVIILNTVQPVAEAVAATTAPLSDVGHSDWPTLGDAKQPVKKRDRAPGDVVSHKLCICIIVSSRA